MNKIISLTGLAMLLFISTTLAQRETLPEWGRMDGKIEQLEKIKLLEELKMDETTMLKFFSRRAEHRKNLKVILGKRDSLFRRLKKGLRSEDEIDYSNEIQEISQIERLILKEKESFTNTLHNILTDKQIVELMVFEFYFRNEIRHQFMKKHMKRMNRK